MAELQHNTALDLTGLNRAQTEAVQATEGPLLVLAGAGTGKTRVLTTRIAYILARGLAYPNQILAVTFTNKAANEMRHRVEGLTGQPSAGMWIGTFHSVCLRILRRHANLLGFQPDFTVLDADDQLRLFKQLLADHNMDAKRYPPALLAAVIGGWKDKALLPAHVADTGSDSAIVTMYRLYQERLKTLAAMDFDDLILHCITLFNTHKDVLAEYHKRFRYILVDEYQDTNVAQYRWLRQLAEGTGNIACVGDDDQSIYGWRGAEVENILRFEKDFPGATVIRLEENYRSTPDILAVASGLIAHNRGRLGKTLFSPGKKPSKPVRVVSVWDERAEANWIADEIEAAQSLQKSRLEDMAILVRAGHQTRAFEECFLNRGIPYRIIGGLRFYERMEIRDAIAYLRVVANPANDLALERIINVPKRGLGATTLEKMRASARARGLPLVVAIGRMIEEGELTGKAQDTLVGLLNSFARWREMLVTTHHADVTSAILNESGYLAMWQQEKTPEAEGRVENLKELLSALREFENLSVFLEHVSLVTDGDKAADTDMVNVMTMHGAKGLEFDSVFLAGWEEGLFPSTRAMEEKALAGLEEERRLAYVGITRAKKNLAITFASSRFVYGQTISPIPSRFIDELPPEHIEMMSLGTGYGRKIEYGVQNSGNREKNITGLSEKLAASFMRPNSQLQTSDAAFRPGQQVSHKSFGNGVITQVEGTHLTVAFRNHGIKKLLAEYVEKV